MRSYPEAIRLRDVDVQAMTANCQTCHRHEYANWQAGPHSATYSRIFTDQAHNGKRMLMDDCFRCHGMYFNGSIGRPCRPAQYQRPLEDHPRRLRGPAHHALPGLSLGPSRGRA